MNDILFQLIRNEIWQEGKIDILLSDDETEKLFKDAKKQAVIGLVINALIKNNTQINRDWVMKAISISNHIKASNEKINGELCKFANFMYKNKVDYRVVKGQTVATLYPNPLLRSAGDIDFYCDKNYFNLTKNLIESKLGIKADNNSAKHIEFKVNGVQYELHSKLTEFSYGKHQRYWEKILENDLKNNKCFVEVNGTEIPVLSPTINTIYLFSHIFYHLIINGIGLRQFCDLALYIDKHYDKIDWDLLDKHLRNLGIKKIFISSGYILTDKLGLKKERFPYKISKWNTRIGLRMLKSIEEDGNWAREKHSIKKKGIAHSIETGYLSFTQSMKYVDAAPLECLLRMPRLGMFFIEKVKSNRLT